MASNYDEYIKELDSGRTAEVQEAEKLYGDMQKDYEENIDKQIGEAEDWETKQTEIQNQNTDFTIGQIEQQKDNTEKDYLKEQKAAYTDYQKQVDPYGVNAEQMAANGLTSSGYSESSKVTMYKAYQNRVAVARETYQRATVEFENAMTQARLQNNAALAEIAYNTYQTKLQLAIQKFQTKNSLLLELANKKASINSTYNSLELSALEKKAEQEAEQIKGDDDDLILQGNPESDYQFANKIELPVFKTRQEYIDYLRENYNVRNANKLYTEEEWRKLKNSNSPPDAVRVSKSYEEYLQLDATYFAHAYSQ